MIKSTRLFALACAVVLAAAGAGAATPVSPSAAPVPAPSPVAAMPAPNSVIYIPRLPTPAELTSAAAAQHLTIDKIAQTSGAITVEYRFADGRLNVVAYQLLPAATVAPASTVVEPAAPVVVPAPPPTVIYTEPPPDFAPSWYPDWDDDAWGPDPWCEPAPMGFDFCFRTGR